MWPSNITDSLLSVSENLEIRHRYGGMCVQPSCGSILIISSQIIGILFAEQRGAWPFIRPCMIFVIACAYYAMRYRRAWSPDQYQDTCMPLIVVWVALNKEYIHHEHFLILLFNYIAFCFPNNMYLR